MPTDTERVIRYHVRVRQPGVAGEVVYADASTNDEAERHALDAARELSPDVGIRVVLVGDGRLRAARAAARDRFTGQRIAVTCQTEGADLSHYIVRASERLAGGPRVTVANLWIDELGRPRWAAEDPA